MTGREKEAKYKEKIIAQLTELCKQYGLVTRPDLLLTTGMLENFDDKGNLEKWAIKDFEDGKQHGWFGDSSREMCWASHLGD